MFHLRVFSRNHQFQAIHDVICATFLNFGDESINEWNLCQMEHVLHSMDLSIHGKFLKDGRVGGRVDVRSRDYQNFFGWIEYQIFLAMALRSRARGAPMKYSQIPARGCLGVLGASIQRPRRIRNWTSKSNKLPTMFLKKKKKRLFNRTKSRSYMSENGYSYHIL